MAMCSPDWSLAALPPHRTLSKTLLSISITHILSITSSSFTNRCFLIANSSKLPSPLLEEASNDQFIQVPPDHPDPQPPPTSDLDISNEFIQDLCKNPKTEALAFVYYNRARDQSSFQPDRQTINGLMVSLLSSKQWSSISALSEDFRVFDIFPDRPTCARLIGSCIQARKFRLAESLLGVLESKKGIALSAFVAAMRGYNKLHMYRSTILVFDRMIGAGLSPNSSCYFWVMAAHRKLGNTEKVLSLFLDFESKKLGSSAFCVRIYSILCDSLGSAGRAFEALRYFREMVGKGIPPNPSFYGSLICCFAAIREAEIAEDLFQESREKAMIRDPAVFQKFVSMYVEVGSVEKTIAVLTAMKEMGVQVSDCISCAVVNGFAKRRGLRASIKAYEQLISLGCEPGQVTYASIINVYGRLGLSAKAEAMFSEMMEKGFHRCVVAYSNMISMYGKSGRSTDAMRLLAKMKEKGCQPNVWVYNSLLDMHGRLMDLRQVEKLWKEMKRRNVDPDRISYTSIISAYSKAREFEECVGFYREFRTNGGKVDRALAGIMVGVFSNSSMVDELIKLLQDLKSEGTEFDGRLYRSALKALRDAGLQVQVKWFEENFKLEKDKT